MVEIEIDGKLVQVPPGGTIMDGANTLGTYIPHFCYHKKLSIAANCRMCLVQVEKAPKPLPACATPATAGMKISTSSDYAVNAQKGVMEFLLINHPLDCPICDQGGECQLQDLAVGYGGSASRYTEVKRVVLNKNLGPLISTDMTRCIHCTRCVRFGQEIAGDMELGMAGRGEHSEIMPFIERTVNSELSGNMIDLCPVGALTSKPFRYTARTWELSRRKSISPHCGLGSNLTVHVKGNRVMRVLPREAEDINECWLSDKDRFSYEGLNAEDRLTKPMIKQGGEWQECEWQDALAYIANGLKDIRNNHGADAIASLVSPHSTIEEMYLLQKLTRGLGSNNIDFRLRQSDFSADAQLQGAPWLGTEISAMQRFDRVLIIGSTLRKEHPLLAHRLRQATKKGAQLSLINPVDDDLAMTVANKALVAPADMPGMLAQVVKAVAEKSDSFEIPAQIKAAIAGVTISDAAQAIAASLTSAENRAIFLGNIAQHHPRAGQLHALAQILAMLINAKFGVLAEAANSVGGFLAGASPLFGVKLAPVTPGLNVSQILANPRKAYILLGVEADLDTANAQQTLTALRSAEMVVSLTAFKGQATGYADVLLPIAPFSETAGTFVSMEGRIQSFRGAVKPLGEARPAWKVLRVLGNLLELSGFDYDSAEAVRLEVCAEGEAVTQYLNNILKSGAVAPIEAASQNLQRIGEVPLYQSDAIVRRAESLQQTADAKAPQAWMPSSLFTQINVAEGEEVRVRSASGEIRLRARIDNKLPANCVRIATAHPLTAALGGMFDTVSVERAQ